MQSSVRADRIRSGGTDSGNRMNTCGKNSGSAAFDEAAVMRLFYEVFDIDPDILLILTPSLIVRNLNRAAEKTLGVMRDTVAGSRSFEFFIDEQFRVMFVEYIRSVFAGEDEGEFECPVITAGRSHRIILWRPRRISDEEGNGDLLILSGFNLSDRLEERNRIEYIEGQLRQAQKLEAVEQLTGSVAHDFCNYIAGIKGLCELIFQELSPRGTVYEYLRQIMESCGRAEKLTQQLLTFGSRNCGVRQSLDLNSVLIKTEKLLSSLAGSGVILTIRRGVGLLKVMAEAERIEQVVMNLVANARDAMEAEGRILITTQNVVHADLPSRVRASLPPGTYVAMSVRDFGTGIDETTLRHIYEPFFTTRKLNGGTGLGLSTVSRIVGEYDGAIDCESEFGKGSEFTVYLPAIE